MHDTATGRTAGIPSAASVAHYRLVPEETEVVFATRHLLGLGRVRGTVRVLAGRMSVDTTAKELLLLEADLDLRSFASGGRARDRVVASAAFLDTEAHPIGVYRSTAAIRTATGWTASGTLTVKGVAAPLDLQIEDLEPETALAASATAVIDRFAYGIDFPTPMASRHLRVDIAARAERVPAL